MKDGDELPGWGIIRVRDAKPGEFTCRGCGKHLEFMLGSDNRCTSCLWRDNEEKAARDRRRLEALERVAEAARRFLDNGIDGDAGVQLAQALDELARIEEGR